MAVIRGAEAAGLHDAIRAPRGHEASFDPARSFHAATVQGHLYVKGAPEVLLERSTHLRRGAATTALDAAERAALLRRATSLAQRGLRVLLVAEGAAADQPSDVAGLEVLGLLGISDPLRPDVAPAVARCRAAGIRVVMLTGDHPATARTIAAEAGLLDGEVLTGPELAQLENGELDARLEEATVIARATPLDKLRIVESLQRRGHTVAMTGDGVNDAPALRLADVGVAMGRSGTEVARQTADVILVDDAFPTLVEALVEGRGFWGHTRRALGLLLGGNLGELGVMAGATLLGGGTGLTVPQILAVNLVTDLLPAIAISVQRPEHRDLQVLAREGAAALGAPLRGEILRRATATALPSLAAFAFATTRGGTEAQGVAFASVVSTQLAQIVALGRSEGRLTRSVAGAAAASTALLGATFAVPSLRRILGLRPLSPVGWTLVAGATLLAPLVNRTLASGDRDSVTEPIRRGRISVA
jgi:magnesium-transporting ATPase (P-type)